MSYPSKRSALSIAVLFACIAAGQAQAQEAAAAPEAKPDNEISFNAAVTSEYRYRGISQTRMKPALQGGADWVNNPTGFYAGTWLSTIKWVKDGGGDGSVEWDVYAGKRGDLGSGFTYDVGGLGYLYPSNSLPTSANTFELYGQVGYGPATLKYSHSLTNLFGFADSKNSQYLDASINQDLGGDFTLNLHLGRQEVKNNDAASYTDWKVGITKDLGIAALSLAFFGTNTEAYYSPNGKNLGKSGAALTLSKTF
jgi:uncharacterized protein (TIGR02001 family)